MYTYIITYMYNYHDNYYFLNNFIYTCIIYTVYTRYKINISLPPCMVCTTAVPHLLLVPVLFMYVCNTGTFQGNEHFLPTTYIPVCVHTPNLCMCTVHIYVHTTCTCNIILYILVIFFFWKRRWSVHSSTRHSTKGTSKSKRGSEAVHSSTWHSTKGHK